MTGKIRNLLTRLAYREKTIRVAWMDEREIDIVEEIIARLRPMKCLEWGSGLSTAYYSRLLSEQASWLAIEHDGAWAEKVTENLRMRPAFWRRTGTAVTEYYLRFAPARSSGRAEVRFIAPDRFPWTDADNDGSYSDLKHYVDYPGDKGPFDLVLVDGRARKDCLIMAHEVVSETGVVLLHDAKRSYYRTPCGLFRSQAEFIDESHTGFGLWMGSKAADFDGILDVERHKARYPGKG